MFIVHIQITMKNGSKDVLSRQWGHRNGGYALPPSKMYYLYWVGGVETRSSNGGKFPPNFIPNYIRFVNSQVISIDTKGS